MQTTATQGTDMTFQQTDWPDTKLTHGERIQLAIGVAINNTINAVVRFAQIVRGSGR